MKPNSAFALLLSRQKSERQRDRLHALRHDHQLAADDPMWAVLDVVEEFCESVHARVQRDQGSRPREPLFPVLGWRSIVLFGSGLSVQTFLMAVSFWGGVRAAGPNSVPWLSATAMRSSWIVRTLALPAGWLMLVQLVPALAYGIHRGWKVRHYDRTVGWTLVATSCMTATAATAILWWLLQG